MTEDVIEHYETFNTKGSPYLLNQCVQHVIWVEEFWDIGARVYEGI